MATASDYTRNEIIAKSHRDQAYCLTEIANFSEKHDYTAEEIIALMREMAEEHEAQAIVVELRDEL